MKILIFSLIFDDLIVIINILIMYLNRLTLSKSIMPLGRSRLERVKQYENTFEKNSGKRQ